MEAYRNELKSAVEQLNIHVQELRAVWVSSGVSKEDRIVQTYPPAYDGLLRDAEQDLRYSTPVFFAQAPDRTSRAHKTSARENANCGAFILEKAYSYTTYEYKSSTYHEGLDEMWVLSNKHVYLKNNHGSFDPEILREWFVNWLREGKPPTTYEALQQVAQAQQHGAEAAEVAGAAEAERQRQQQDAQAQRQRWEAKGLCTHCGGDRSFWTGKCKKCGR